jgi:outer membrane protein
LKGKTQEDLKNDPALLSKVQSFQKEQQELSVDVQYKQQEMKITENKAIQKVQDRLRVILELIVKEREADVVLERSLVIYGDPVDVTDVVITRLNSQLKTVPVKRERLPRQ